MLLNDTGHIMRPEWRWLVLISIILVIIAFTPFIVLGIWNIEQDQQFMGAIHYHQNASASISRMAQGQDGQWLVHLQHTPDTHLSALIEPIYPLLGQISRYTSSNNITVFHIARLLAAFVMYLTLYQLAASIWFRVRTRRIFFILVSVTSGFGWIFLFQGQPNYPDLTTPQAFPFLSSLANVHYPIAIACTAILTGIIVSTLRPGMAENPSINNDGVLALLMSITLAFIYPDALITIGFALALSIVIHWWNQRTITTREVYWALWILVPALPIAMYYILTWQNNPIIPIWVGQHIIDPPNILNLLISLGLPLLIGIPGIFRAIRRFEADGDRYMLLWLFVMLIGAYVPIPFGQTLYVGLMIPIAYFATRSLEDFWFQYLTRRLRRRLYIIIIPLMVISNLVSLIFPLYPLMRGHIPESFMMSRAYSSALDWLQDHTRPHDIILASPISSTWIPYWTGGRSVYGHPRETIYPDERLQIVNSWYRATDVTQVECDALIAPLPNTQNPVRYILYGEYERDLGQSDCLPYVDFVASFGDVYIYSTRPFRSFIR